MKKLLTSLATITLIGNFAVSLTAWTNQFGFNNQNLQDFQATNKVDANEFGNPASLVPSTTHRTEWYLRFYMNPAIYNMLSLTATASHTFQNPAQHFWQFFLGEAGKSPEYGTWNQAITQYENLIQSYDTLYGQTVNFSTIFQHWLTNNWSNFYKIFIGLDFSTNIYRHYNLPPSLTVDERRTFLDQYWRDLGIVMNIPFKFNQTNKQWSIDLNNLRIFPQIEGIQSIYYYYSATSNTPPTLDLPNPDKVSEKRAVEIRQDIYNAFLNAINPPRNMRNAFWYSNDRRSLQNVIIHKRSWIGYPAATINFNYELHRPIFYVTDQFAIKFYLSS